MEKASCCVCQKPKATLHCGLCQSSTCKSCAIFLEEGQFSFLAQVPEKLSHSTYCGPCYTTNVDSEIAAYNDTMEKARNISVFYVTDSKLTRNFSRKEKPIKVVNCADRDEALLRLAFLAVKENFNAIIDVNIVGEKVRSGTYQTTNFSGTAIPAHLTSSRI